MLTVNKIYTEFQKGNFTRKESSSHLLGEIFKSPWYYSLEGLSEDEISSFLVWVHSRIPKILDNYDTESSSFITYFTTAIRLLVKSWRRDFIKDTLLQDILDNHHYKEFSQDDYVLSEPNLPYGTSKASKINLKKPLSTRHTLTILVLTLRSIYTLNQSVIDKIPSLTGIPREEFNRYVDTIKDKMKDKKQVYDELELKINRNFIFYQQYEIELQKLNPDTAQYLAIKRKYQFYKKRLNQLRQLRNNFKLHPSNKLVEDTLKIPIGTVRRIVANAEKNISQIQQLLDPQKD